ncbi:MAG TPA: acetylxylan esterase [Kiritimatiellia bacterium]|nr:acetylxylan esterase [Kiritimatiellia bacterium]
MADESTPPVLPELLRLEGGQPVTTREEWEQRRRPELLEWFRANVYGRAPVGRTDGMRFTLLESGPAFEGIATRKQVRILFSDDPEAPYMDVLVYIPNQRTGPAPVFLGPNARGNHALSDDPAVPESTKRSIGQPRTRLRGGTPWPIERVIRRGYALATFHVSDVAPDMADGWKDGVQSLFDPVAWPDGRPDDAWGTIAVWAWGMSRVIDYLETDPDLDARRVAVFGQSRRGKAALWCAIEDERIALAIGNNSVGLGSALSRVPGGNDTIAHLVNYSPFWFSTRLMPYAGQDAAMPVDQHQFLALIAPRRVYVACAANDKYAIPARDFWACRAADPAWRLYGLSGFPSEAMPPPGEPLHGGHIAFHIREGAHGHEEQDWTWQLDYADRHL